MRADTNSQRLACPRCRANNFVGQAQCWQCGASLPPPEALGAANRVARTQPPLAPTFPPANTPAANPPQENWTAGTLPVAPRSRSKTPLVMAGALITAGVVVLLLMRHPAGSGPAPMALPPGMSAGNSGGVLPNGMLPGSQDVRLAQPDRDDLPLSSDPNEIAARRAIQRAIPRLGLPPGAASDDKVHLQNGDTISREQYEEVQRKLKSAPILGGPPTVPRL